MESAILNSGRAESILRMRKSESWDMTPSQWGSWGSSALGSLGGTAVNSLGIGQALGGFAQDQTFDLGDNLCNSFGLGIQNMTAGFISSTFAAAGSALGSGMNWQNMTMNPNTWNFNNVNMSGAWGGILNNSVVAGVSGFGEGFTGSLLGGSYDPNSGGMTFQDAAGRNLFYSGQLNNFDNFVGSIVGQVANYNMTGMFNVNLGAGLGLSYVSGQDFQRNDGAGGVSLDQGIQVAAQDMNFVGFQAANAGSATGQSTITYVNTGYLSGNALAQGISMDVINGTKKIAYDLNENNGTFGYAGGINDNSTIHLASQAVLDPGESDLNQKLAFYTSTMDREGLLLNDHASLDAQVSDLGQNEQLSINKNLELEATKAQLGVMADLDQNLGISVAGSAKYEALTGALAYSAITGDEGVLDYSSGRAFNIRKLQMIVLQNQKNGNIYTNVVTSAVARNQQDGTISSSQYGGKDSNGQAIYYNVIGQFSINAIEIDNSQPLRDVLDKIITGGFNPVQSGIFGAINVTKNNFALSLTGDYPIKNESLIGNNAFNSVANCNNVADIISYLVNANALEAVFSAGGKTLDVAETFKDMNETTIENQVYGYMKSLGVSTFGTNSPEFMAAKFQAYFIMWQRNNYPK
jgi:hypothetical protein